MAKITIDQAQFFAGERSHDFSEDGGYGRKSKGLNPIYKKGMMYGQESSDIVSSDVGETIIASCQDELANGNDLYLIDDTGQLYSLKNGVLTARGDASGASGQFDIQYTDLVYFRGDVYATTSEEIVKFSGADKTTVDTTWWTVTEGNSALNNLYHHSFEIVEGVMFISDKDNFHIYDGTTSQEDAMELPGLYNITSTVKHPNGKNIFAFTGTVPNFQGTDHTVPYAYLIDTVSLEFTSEIKLEEQVFSAVIHKGVIYVRYGKNGMKFGYFDGTKLQLIRDLQELSVNNSLDGYKHTMKSFGEFLLITTDDGVFAYGQILAGTNSFWTLFERSTASQVYFCDYTEDQKIAVQYLTGSDKRLATIDFEDVGNNMDFYTGQISLGGSSVIYKIDIEHSEVETTGNFGFDLYYVDTNGTETLIGEIDYSNIGGTLRSSKIYPNIFCDSFFELRVVGSAGDMGISKITIHYEGNE